MQKLVEKYFSST